MSSAEKLCLQWNDFQENILSSFKDLRLEKEFTDVTLACEDGQQIEAHKIVLTSSSPLFKNLLKANKHQHPLVYMRGVKSEDLHAILDFLYCGEANVYQHHLDSFLAMADELKLKGLTGGGQEKELSESTFVPATDFKGEPSYQNEQSLPRKKKQPEPEPRTTFERKSERTVSLVNSTVSADSDQLDEQIKSMIDSSENFVTRKNGRQMKASLCKVCGKELVLSDMMRHIEANHLTGVTHSCDICGKISRSRNGLRHHNYEKHRS